MFGKIGVFFTALNNDPKELKLSLVKYLPSAGLKFVNGVNLLNHIISSHPALLGGRVQSSARP